MIKINYLMLLYVMGCLGEIICAADSASTDKNNASTNAVVIDLSQPSDTTGSCDSTAKDVLSNWFHGENLTGEWNGLRPKLAKNGLTVNISYLGNFAANPIGGRKQGATNSSSTNLGFSLELGALTGLRALDGWTINNTWVWRTGESLTKNYLDNQFNVQQNFGAQTIKLQALNISKSQSLLNDCLTGSLKVGRFAAGDDFMHKAIYGLYMNNAVDGNPVGVFNQTKWSAYPGSCWAIMGELKTSDGKYFKSGLYQINSDVQDSNDRHGLDFSFEEGIGVNFNNELGWDFNHDNSGKSPGNISFGMVNDWYDAPHIDNSLAIEHYNTTLYFQADYMIWNMSNSDCAVSCSTPSANGDSYQKLRGLILWAVGQYDPYSELATLPLFFNGGIIFNAPFKCRPDDALSFGMAWGGYSEKLTTRQKGKYEMMLELNYKAQLNRFLFIQPALQYILNTKGGEHPDALVLGMQFGAGF